MSDELPFGADTLVIPFTRTGGTAPRPESGMSRMRPSGELSRRGVVATAPRPDETAGPDEPD